MSNQEQINQPHIIQVAKANANTFGLDFDGYILCDYINQDNESATRAFHTARSEERAEFWRFMSWARRNKRIVRIIPASLLAEPMSVKTF